MSHHFWQLPVMRDHRGSLSPIEFRDLPFAPKRAYLVFENHKARGGHAHEKEKEIFVCVKGNFRARLHDGKKFHSFAMKRTGQALYVPNMIWHEFDRFTKGASMLAVSSIHYQGRKGYIMDFENFLSLCRKKRKS